ncbi:MAG: amino acid adenylation domain-containing protein [Lachnospiraceae bacterium]|nr:amino acid adenylation domain-containing protein [Lachnospiraceae bacterium]
MVRLVTDYLDNVCDVLPDKIALSEKDRGISFSDLRRNARSVATGLSERGIFRRPVAVFLDKGIDMIVSFWGCAYSGNFYSPIDPDMPGARIKSIFDTLEPECVITSPKYVDSVHDIDPSVKIMLYSELEATVVSEDLLFNVSQATTDKDVLYVLFTSGSTGKPKGVIISHHATISYTEWASSAFDINSEDVLGNQTPFYFSMSVFDIYQTVSRGCTLEILPKELFTAPDRMIDYLNERGVNTIYWVPSALNIVAKSGILNEKNVDFLRKILFAGEVMPNSILNIWRKANGKALYANLFGPTELTDICTYYVVDRDFSDNDPLPIGKACLNTDIMVLDQDDHLILPEDTESVGELCVRGSILAYGYYHNSEKTKEVFVQNPLNHVYDEMIYRTGDLVRYNEYAELMYVGRKDFQVKVSGYRIELGEIETAVSSIPSVRLNCCIFDHIDKLLILYYEGDEGKKEIRKQLKDLLPRYMMPHKYIRLDKMPLNANGKIDRTKLKEEYFGKVAN